METNCPYCGKPMEKGFMITNPRYPIFWFPETAKKVPWMAAYCADVEEQNGVILSPGGQILKREHPWKRYITAKEMYVCRACGKGVVDL